MWRIVGKIINDEKSTKIIGYRLCDDRTGAIGNFTLSDAFKVLNAQTVGIKPISKGTPVNKTCKYPDPYVEYTDGAESKMPVYTVAGKGILNVDKIIILSTYVNNDKKFYNVVKNGAVCTVTLEQILSEYKHTKNGSGETPYYNITVDLQNNVIKSRNEDEAIPDITEELKAKQKSFSKEVSEEKSITDPEWVSANKKNKDDFNTAYDSAGYNEKIDDSVFWGGLKSTKLLKLRNSVIKSPFTFDKIQEFVTVDSDIQGILSRIDNRVSKRISSDVESDNYKYHNYIKDFIIYTEEYIKVVYPDLYERVNKAASTFKEPNCYSGEFLTCAKILYICGTGEGSAAYIDACKTIYNTPNFSGRFFLGTSMKYIAECRKFSVPPSFVYYTSKDTLEEYLPLLQKYFGTDIAENSCIKQCLTAERRCKDKMTLMPFKEIDEISYADYVKSLLDDTERYKKLKNNEAFTENEKMTVGNYVNTCIGDLSYGLARVGIALNQKDEGTIARGLRFKSYNRCSDIYVMTTHHKEYQLTLLESALPSGIALCDPRLVKTTASMIKAKAHNVFDVWHIYRLLDFIFTFNLDKNPIGSREGRLYNLKEGTLSICKEFADVRCDAFSHAYLRLNCGMYKAFNSWIDKPDLESELYSVINQAYKGMSVRARNNEAEEEYTLVKDEMGCQLIAIAAARVSYNALDDSIKQAFQEYVSIVEKVGNANIKQRIAYLKSNVFNYNINIIDIIGYPIFNEYLVYSFYGYNINYNCAKLIDVKHVLALFDNLDFYKYDGLIKNLNGEIVSPFDDSNLINLVLFRRAAIMGY